MNNAHATTAELRSAIHQLHYANEADCVAALLEYSNLSRYDRQQISDAGVNLVDAIRNNSDPALMETFLAEYGLSSTEGVALMCLAEALLRVPDDATVDALIHDKIVAADWGRHLGQSSSSLVNASTWALMLTGKVIDDEPEGVVGLIHGLVKKLGEPLIRTAVNQAIRELGNQFVLGSSIDEALKNSATSLEQGFGYSYDMLGEAALTDADARRFHLSYSRAIAALGLHCNTHSVADNPGISVKLSALFPRYEHTQHDRVKVELVARARSLAMLACSANMGFNIDAEEADRLDLSLEVIEQVLSEPSLANWDGFGVVVQAYSPRAIKVLEWLYDLAERYDRRIMVRLVKGAYWDTEIKRAQVEGCRGYPVFTRKAHTDVSYIACAQKLFTMTDRIYPQFATHNAHSVCAILHMAKTSGTMDANSNSPIFEFQRLHGMGEALHRQVLTDNNTRCRIYAPVGRHKQLLAYLVRRLLENGANSSFVNQIVDASISPETIAEDPFLSTQKNHSRQGLPAPDQLFTHRQNSRGYDFSHPPTLDSFLGAREQFVTAQWKAGVSGSEAQATAEEVCNPSDGNDIVGFSCDASEPQIETAWQQALQAFPQWRNNSASSRAQILDRAADLYESNSEELAALLCREAGKTLQDAIAEIREAVDFLRYYGQRSITLFEAAHQISPDQPAVARGIFVCISPWNFPLAIFTGQIAAALATGNCVLAKPADQTTLTGARATQLLQAAGLPEHVLQLVPGRGSTVGAALVSDARLAGVCFTGSTATAARINQSMASQCSTTAPLIAETGGINAMIVDSTALPEQAVQAVIESAFQSAGQRCSALRVLYVQSDIRDTIEEMLCGAMAELRVDNPWLVHSDLGPLIDQAAKTKITDYCSAQKIIFQTTVSDSVTNRGTFFPPTLIEIGGIGDVAEEIFGPVLHLAEFEAADFFSVLDDINNCGYGLTFGLQTRVDERVQDALDRLHAGNLYVNRNQIGAIVESQPFGGKGMSGTGPKAGGPHYLLRFLGTERANPVVCRPVPVDGNTKALSAAAAALTTGTLIHALTPPNQEELAAIAVATGIDTAVAAEALRYAALHHHETIDLPGPTGESNRLSVQPCGTVVCIQNGNADYWLAQTLQALALGNAVIAMGQYASAVAEFCQNRYAGCRILAVDQLPAVSNFQQLDKLAAVTAQADSNDTLRPLREALAQRSGSIIPLSTQLFDISPLISETTLCIDTTAAGGNAALLARAE